MQKRAPAVRWRRIQRRLLRHHVPLAVISILLMIGVDLLLHPYGRIAQITVASAYTALALIGATLMLGPLNILRKRPNPVSTDLRRDVGIWAALLSLAHMLVGFLTHYPGEPWRFFINGGTIPLRLDSFGRVNLIGLAAILIATLLLCLSNDWSLRKLGNAPWKMLQRLNYALIIGAFVHGLLYLHEEDRGEPYLLLTLGLFAAVVLVQAAGIWRRLTLARGSSPQHV
ncbi:ferric reductase-like transmembrane domain-containing protein [Oscillochloris sp. ZM17-4]|uniref:ferric reductase-like transmembrane domain-containing protein n=1 Tax=Oscillochloris sp. ZM17-4 TaxID=2866714 RepID=UPI001C737B05|nr:ferric reductase-like transmembrane domain-containing protein [Oscillochloris sp. ZM17-4]MBX0329148.1 ferric reductase-like transmembrane domain-containing protein [Oscillochloris sp. ZM17-4]